MGEDIQKQGQLVVFDTPMLIGAAQAYFFGETAEGSKKAKLAALCRLQGRSVRLGFNRKTRQQLNDALLALHKDRRSPTVMHAAMCNDFRNRHIHPIAVELQVQADLPSQLAFRAGASQFVCNLSLYARQPDILSIAVPPNQLFPEGRNEQLAQGFLAGRHGPSRDKGQTRGPSRTPIVIDTNVLVGALVETARGDNQRFGNSYMVDKAMREHSLVFSAISWAEFEYIGRRTLRDFTGRRGHKPAQELFDAIRASRHMVEKKDFPVACRDEDDQMILETALGAGAKTIVSGDRDLLGMRFRTQPHGVDCLSPEQFLVRLENRAYAEANRKPAHAAPKAPSR